jgi:hypothetical protein
LAIGQVGFKGRCTPGGKKSLKNLKKFPKYLKKFKKIYKKSPEM